MPMSPALIKFTSVTHLFWYRLTGGIIGGRFGDIHFLLLTTTGRRSGKQRTTPLLYMRDGDDLVVVGSNGGNDNHPAWYYNIRANSNVHIEVGREKFIAHATVADAEQRSRLWPKLVDVYRQYEGYQRDTDREIPLVILKPAP
jgi:deazaflavin-dependent oxidoreductase (nitroreductase family)